MNHRQMPQTHQIKKTIFIHSKTSGVSTLWSEYTKLLDSSSGQGGVLFPLLYWLTDLPLIVHLYMIRQLMLLITLSFS